MKYLLSTGRVTKDVVTYIQDLIRIQMGLRPNQIPYWNGGSDDLITALTEDHVESRIQSIIEKIIQRVIDIVPSAEVSLKSVTIIGSIIRVIIDINGITGTYDIKRTN